MINKELRAIKRTAPHPLLARAEESRFSELISKEIERVAAGKKIKGGIDLTRYDAPETPSANADVKAWRDILRQAYSASSYIAARQTNLQLLEEMGKNAWLISNSQLEELIKSLERELERLKRETGKHKQREEDHTGNLTGRNCRPRCNMERRHRKTGQGAARYRRAAPGSAQEGWQVTYYESGRSTCISPQNRELQVCAEMLELTNPARQRDSHTGSGGSIQNATHTNV